MFNIFMSLCILGGIYGVEFFNVDSGFLNLSIAWVWMLGALGMLSTSPSVIKIHSKKFKPRLRQSVNRVLGWMIFTSLVFFGHWFSALMALIYILGISYLHSQLRKIYKEESNV